MPTVHTIGNTAKKAPGKTLARLFPGLLACLLGASLAGAPIDTAALSSKLRTLQSVEDKLRTSGKYDSYAEMRLRLARRFLDYLRHDITRHREPLTEYAARDLNALMDQELERVQAILAGKQSPVVSPRRIQSDAPIIVDSHLEQKVVWPDGTVVRRPIFLFGFGHFGGVQRDIDFLASLGCNFCQVELGPHHVWKAEGVWNQEVVDRYRAFIRQADSAGVLVDLLLSPHYFPKWQYKKHPDWLAHSGGFNKFSLDRPGLRDFLKTTFQREIRELSIPGNPKSVCLMNEPVFFNAWGDPDTRPLWEKYLKHKYETLDNLNDCWETDYAGWKNVPDYKSTPPCPLKPDPGLYDWMTFNDRRFAGFNHWLSNCVHQSGTGALTHVKATCREFTQYNVMQGVDVDLLAQAADMAGNDWGCILSEEADLTQNLPFALGFSIMHLACGHPLVNSENHLIRGGTSDVRPNAVRAPFWLQAVCGLDASAAWSWEKWDKPEGDWTLGMWLYRPRATEEYVRTGMDLMRLMPDVLALRNAPCRIAVLHSRTTALRYPKYAKYIKRTFSVLMQMGLPVGVVTERMIADRDIAKKLPDLKVLVLPGSVYLPDNVYTNLKILAANTGRDVRLIGVGRNIAKYNEFALPRDVDFLNDTSILYRNLPFKNEAELWAGLNTALASFGVRREFTLIDNTTGQPVHGVFYRIARSGSPRLATVVNMTYAPITCHWQDGNKNTRAFRDDLALVHNQASEHVVLSPLQVLCGDIQPRR